MRLEISSYQDLQKEGTLPLCINKEFFDVETCVRNYAFFFLLHFESTEYYPLNHLFP